SDQVLELAEEFLDRYRKGERPSLKEYADRHPELAGEIREVLPAMAMMEHIALADESLGGEPTGDVPAPRPTALERPGDYRILRTVGEGGMGVVYEAMRQELGSHVALKVLHPRYRAAANYLRRFRDEARAAARLHHTNIVSVFDFGAHEGVCYYVMQYIAGQ